MEVIMENLIGEIGNDDNKSDYVNFARFRLSVDELDVTKDMVLTGEKLRVKES
jgi:hypothetical protein